MNIVDVIEFIFKLLLVLLFLLNLSWKKEKYTHLNLRDNTSQDVKPNKSNTDTHSFPRWDCFGFNLEERENTLLP